MWWSALDLSADRAPPTGQLIMWADKPLFKISSLCQYWTQNSLKAFNQDSNKNWTLCGIGCNQITTVTICSELELCCEACVLCDGSGPSESPESSCVVCWCDSDRQTDFILINGSLTLSKQISTSAGRLLKTGEDYFNSSTFTLICKANTSRHIQIKPVVQHTAGVCCDCRVCLFCGVDCWRQLEGKCA